jgi:hypothetical protein
MAIQAPRGLHAVGSAPSAAAEVRAGRAALVTIRDELNRNNRAYLAANQEVARELARELSQGTLDLVAKYWEHKPRLDQLEERRICLTFFRQAVTELWSHLKTEHAGLARQVLIEERETLEAERDEHDREAEARIGDIEQELADLVTRAAGVQPTRQEPEPLAFAPETMPETAPGRPRARPRRRRGFQARR